MLQLHQQPVNGKVGPKTSGAIYNSLQPTPKIFYSTVSKDSVDQSIRELKQSIRELKQSIRELKQSIRELKQSIRELKQSIRELKQPIRAPTNLRRASSP
jgi:peptidoglycan hydrolase CwlO-like protein